MRVLLASPASLQDLDEAATRRARLSYLHGRSSESGGSRRYAKRVHCIDCSFGCSLGGGASNGASSVRHDRNAEKS